MSKALGQRSPKTQAASAGRDDHVGVARAGKGAAEARKRAYLIKSASPDDIARSIQASQAKRKYAARIAAMVTSSSS